jgi:CRP-like cAMP-binding protein
VSRKRDWSKGGGWASRGGGRGGGAAGDDTWGGSAPPIPPHIILPNERAYLAWFVITLFAACASAIFDPYCIAFSAHPGLYPWNDAQAVLCYAITAVFVADVAVRFRLAYVDPGTGELVTHGPAIARRYARGLLAIDLLAAIPWDWIVIAAVSPDGADTPLARYLTLLGLLRLLRLYRVRLALVAAEANLAISLLGSTIVRNLSFVFYLAHWAACGFYFCARMAAFGPATWVGRGGAGLVGGTTPDKYLASLYWAVTVFTTTGFGDLVAVNRAETVWTILYMLAALVLGTYVLGTTTLLLIKGDEAKGRYRDQAAALKAYAHLNGLPPPLEGAMHEHLRLAHANADIADEAVLGHLPATLRRRALRHLYAAPLKACYLFAGGRQRFLDALLAACEVELLMAGVDVISDGDHVPDLLVCVSGALELTLPGVAEVGEDVPLIGTAGGVAAAAAASATPGPDPNRSVRLGVRRHLGAGDPVGEVSFFTDVPHCGTARTATVSRVLVIPRAAWERVSADFPLGTRTVLDNLRGRAQELVDSEFRGAAGRALLAAAPPGIAHAQASAEAGRGGGAVGAGRSAGGPCATCTPPR